MRKYQIVLLGIIGLIIIYVGILQCQIVYQTIRIGQTKKEIVKLEKDTSKVKAKAKDIDEKVIISDKEMETLQSNLKQIENDLNAAIARLSDLN